MTKLLLGGLLLSLALLTACGETGGTPPNVSIVSPAVNATLTGTVAVQLAATDDKAVAKVQLFARAAGSTAPGVALGSATRAPYVVSLLTGALPSGNDLELYATAYDDGGRLAKSDPVRVRVQNPGAPTLSYLAAFTLPKNGLTTQDVRTRGLPDHTMTSNLRAPVEVGATGLAPASTSAAPRDFVAEWGWPSASGATGYNVYAAEGDLAGPYTLQLGQRASAAGTQKYSKILPNAAAGDLVYGTVTALTGANLAEGAKSNADRARFLPPQEVASPADNQSVADGRPILTWNRLAGATGYVYYLYDRDPWDEAANVVWSNYPNTTAQQSVAYPGSLSALPKGTYFWWVAGVSFDANGFAESFSFSDARRIVVP